MGQGGLSADPGSADDPLAATAAGSDPRNADDPLAATVTGVDPRPAPGTGTGIAIGATLDRYRIVRRLGEGGMGIVYEALDPELDRRVALKVLRRPARGSSPEAVERRARLVREAQAMARLSHVNVVQVFDAGTVDEDVFVAMELVDGDNLAAWLAARPRRWRAIVDVFIQAVHGLGEAHRMGLVHRDFKPSNVIVGKDGRVRVLDFGLARAIGTRESGRADAPSGSALDSPLTVEGSLLGTPMYMAPEQWAGGVADARSDQYSVCASLWEALAGVPPFAGDDLSTLEAAVAAGQIRAFPDGVDVPRRLVKVALRGMRLEPAARFASVDELGRELARIRSRRRKLVTGAIVAAALGATAVAAFAIGRRDVATPPACTGGEDRLAGVWDAPVKSRIRAAFTASPWSGAASTYTSVERNLDGYSAGWSTMRTQACEATRRGEQSPALLDLRMTCLDHRLGELAALSALFATPDPEVVLKAVAATLELTPVAVCADSAALRELMPLPTDPAARARIAALRTALEHGRVLRQAGKYVDGLAVMRPLEQEADAIGYAPVQAEALFVLAELEDWGGDATRAEALYRRAAAAAGVAGDDKLVATAWAALVYVIGIVQARYADALEVAEFAASVAAGKRDPTIAAKLHNNRGSVHRALGQLDDAERELELAVSLREASLGPDHPSVATSLANLGAVMKDQRRWDAAQELGERSLAIRRRVLGPTHPDVAQNLTNLGAIASARGDQAGAMALEQEALAITRAAYGAGANRLTAESLNNLGAYAMELQRFADATAAYGEAVEMFRAVVPATHPYLGIALAGQAESLVRLGRPAEAIPLATEAVEIHTRPDASPMALASSRFALGIALAESGKDRVGGRKLVVLARDAYAAARVWKWHAQAEAWLAK